MISVRSVVRWGAIFPELNASRIWATQAKVAASAFSSISVSFSINRSMSACIQVVKWVVLLHSSATFFTASVFRLA